MFRLNTLWLQLAIALLLALFIAGCSSSEDDGGATGGAPAAAASSGGGDEATEGYKLTQAFDMSIEVTSPVFSRIRRIPKDHSCTPKALKAGQASGEGLNYDPTATFANSSPPLEWTGVPEGAVSIALVMVSDQVTKELEYDPKAGTESAPDNAWSHWVIWNIPADSTGLSEGVATTTEALAIGSNTRQGVNDDKTVGYSGPCPLTVTIPGWQGSGYLGNPKVVFSYFFHVYALDVEVDLGPETTKGQLLKAIDGHVLAGGEIKGEFVARRNTPE